MLSANQDPSGFPCPRGGQKMEATSSEPAPLREKRAHETRERIRLQRESTDRLYWTLAGDFPACVSVMKTSKSGRDGLEPLQNPDGTWHEVASLPMQLPPVASIKASLRFLDEWEHDWVQDHECHKGGEYVTYGELDDADRPYAREMKEDGSWEEDSDTEFLIRCCGSDRPMHWRGLTLQVAASTGNEFVTIKDYVSGNLYHCCKICCQLSLTLCSRASVAHEPTRIPRRSQGVLPIVLTWTAGKGSQGEMDSHCQLGARSRH